MAEAWSVRRCASTSAMVCGCSSTRKVNSSLGSASARNANGWLDAGLGQPAEDLRGVVVAHGRLEDALRGADPADRRAPAVGHQALELAQHRLGRLGVDRAQPDDLGGDLLDLAGREPVHHLGRAVAAELQQQHGGLARSGDRGVRGRHGQPLRSASQPRSSSATSSGWRSTSACTAWRRSTSSALPTLQVGAGRQRVSAGRRRGAGRDRRRQAVGVLEQLEVERLALGRRALAAHQERDAEDQQDEQRDGRGLDHPEELVAASWPTPRPASCCLAVLAAVVSNGMLVTEIVSPRVVSMPAAEVSAGCRVARLTPLTRRVDDDRDRLLGHGARRGLALLGDLAVAGCRRSRRS